MRLVEESEGANCSCWPMHPTWQQLREAFGQLTGVPPLDDEKRTFVRGARYRGRMRILRRLKAGVIRSLEVEGCLTHRHCAHDVAARDGTDRGEGGGIR